MKSTRTLQSVVAAALLASGVLATLVSLTWADPASAQAAGKDAPKAPAEAESLRPEVAKLLKAAQDFINAKQFKEGLAKLNEADAISGKTPYESYIQERLRGPAAAGAGETAVAVKSFQLAYDTGRLNAAERIQFSEAIAVTQFQQKDFKAAALWTRRAIENGSKAAQIKTIMIRALLLSEDFAAATKEIDASILEEQKVGRVPAQEMLLFASTAAYKQSNDAAYINALELLAVNYPSNEYWTDFIGRVARSPNIAERYMSDIFRLKMTLGQPLTAAQYLFMAQTAKGAGFPIDATKVMDAGIAAGVLSIAEHKQFRDLVAKDAADDVKNMAKSSADAAKAKEGLGLFNSGLNYVYNGETDKGLNMMEQGIKRPGIRRPDDLRLKLGIAYALAGEKVAAVETLAEVKGTEGATEVARVWAAYAKQKSAAVPVASPAAGSTPAKAAAPTK